MRKVSLLLLVLMLAGCNQTATEPADPVEVEVNEVDEVTQYQDDVYGVSFEYPANWYETDFGTIKEDEMFHAMVSNFITRESGECKEGEATFLIEIVNYTETGEEFTTFKEHFMSNYVESTSSQTLELGQYAGEYEEVTLAGLPAYKMEKMIMDTPCESTGYVFDYTGKMPGMVGTIYLFSNEGDMEALAKLEEIVASLELSGPKK